MRTDNLSRWVDELAATIEDLEKRVDHISIAPPAPGNQIIIEDLGQSPIYANLTLPTGKTLNDYQYLLVTVISANADLFYDTMAEGLFTNTYGEVGYTQNYIFGNSEYTFMMQTPAENEIGLSQQTSQSEQYLIYRLQGIKYVEPETATNRSLLKRAADAVKNIMKGGR